MHFEFEKLDVYQANLDFVVLADESQVAPALELLRRVVAMLTSTTRNVEAREQKRNR